MGIVKGQLQYQRWAKGEFLGRRGSILANCYACNGFESGAEDCGGKKTCPLYPWFIYASNKPLKMGVKRASRYHRKGVAK